MINYNNSQKNAGYIKIQQKDSFEEEGIFSFDSSPAQSPQTTKTHKNYSNLNNSYSNSRKKRPPLVPCTFTSQESCILIEQEEETTTRDYFYATHQLMGSLNENGDALYSVSAPERSATVESIAEIEEEFETNNKNNDDSNKSYNNNQGQQYRYHPHPSSSTWSQISRKFLKGGKRKYLDEYHFIPLFKPIITSLKDWQPTLMTLTSDHRPPISTEQFLAIVESVKIAIESGNLPQRISQGSSGSYFCRNKEGKKVGVFKPKNEEPYGHLNPKWTKWIHRNLFPCFFGRSCLIPNLGYISEAGASLLDQRLQLNIVPPTKVTHLSSPSFHYDYLDRHAAQSKKNPKPLPEKIGSFQVFLEGFKDANDFLRDHPWPDNNSQSTLLMRTASQEIEDGQERQQQHRRLNTLICLSNNGLDNGDESEESYPLGRRFVWTEDLQLQFREQFEKLVILDYLMRNTDRGLDNWMIKYCEQSESANVANSPPKPVNMMSTKKSMDSDSENPPLNTSSCDVIDNIASTNADNEPLNSAKIPSSSCNQESLSIPYPHVHVAAIDNGLAFPFKHPDSWRSYPYGWTYLPTSLIRKPFTQKTRDHFLPLLSSPQWWKETVNELRVLFSMDADFDEGMFQKQISVLKGQGWNIIETLTQKDQDDNNPAGIPTNDAIGGEPVSELFPPPPKIRRSMSEDSGSIQRPSAAASAAGKSSLTTASQKWAAKLKSKLNFDSKQGDSERRKKKIIYERLEPVKGAVPLFSCC